MQHQRPLTVMAVVLSCIGATAAQTRAQIEFRRVGDKTITCQRMPPSQIITQRACKFLVDLTCTLAVFR
jgi:hypothetical protein